MNSQKLCLITIALILCSCSSQSQPPTTSQKNQEPISAQAKQSVKLPEKAEKVCGDPSPADSKAYPVSFYPVSVEYTDRNLELVRKHFCEDARRMPSKSLGKDVLQVASFTSQEKAEAFKEKLSPHFAQARIGEPTIIGKPKPDMGDRQSSDARFDAMTPMNTNFPELNESQLKKLKLLHERIITTPRKESSVKLKVALPTVLPSQTKIIHFAVNDTSKPDYSIRDNPLSYTLLYKTNQNSCFRITLDNGQWGDAPTGWPSVQVETPFFGKVPVEQATFDTGSPVLSQFIYDIKDETGKFVMYRYFMSVNFESPGIPETKGCNSNLPFDSAVKILQSMRSID
jgi:hypothetical protein